MELRIAIVEDQKFEAQQLKTQENFLVCNRGLLLNMDKVLRFEGDCIEMLDGALTALCLGCAALCTIFELPSNVFLLPILIVSFRLLRWRTEGVTVSQTAFLFSISAVMLAVCSLLAVVLNARAETGNQQEDNLVSTALLALDIHTGAIVASLPGIERVDTIRTDDGWTMKSVWCRTVVSAAEFAAAGGQGTPATWLHTVTFDNLHPQTIAAIRVNGLTGKASDYKLYAKGTDGQYHAFTGSWSLENASGRLRAQKVYEIRFTLQDGGDFDRSTDAADRPETKIKQKFHDLGVVFRGAKWYA